MYVNSHTSFFQQAGLSSALIHSQFTKIPGGALSLVRRCSAITCEGHCTCAPQDERCHSVDSCNDVSSGELLSFILYNTQSLMQWCSVITCEGHCTCAPQDERSHSVDSCNDVSSGELFCHLFLVAPWLVCDYFRPLHVTDIVCVKLSLSKVCAPMFFWG